MKARYLWQFFNYSLHQFRHHIVSKKLNFKTPNYKILKKKFFQPFYMNNFDKTLWIVSNDISNERLFYSAHFDILHIQINIITL